MKKKILHMLLGICVCISTLSLSGCKKEKSILTDEPLKSIVGSWKIVKLTRNGEDMTARIDLSKFRLIFNADNTYALQDQMAFIVSEPGTYKLDDPKYPFYLSLSPQNSTDGSKVKFGFPIIAGQRQVNLTISPGCSSNIYEYIFEKSN
jgi:hypothetical protein